MKTLVALIALTLFIVYAYGKPACIPADGRPITVTIQLPTVRIETLPHGGQVVAMADKVKKHLGDRVKTPQIGESRR